jgi:hypothetical protein
VWRYIHIHICIFKSPSTSYTDVDWLAKFASTKSVVLSDRLRAGEDFRLLYQLIIWYKLSLYYVDYIPFSMCTGWVVVLNAAFKNISVISFAVSLIGGGNRSTRWKTPTCRKSPTNFITLRCIEYTSPWARFELTTFVVIGTDCIGSCKSNYHTIMTTTTPFPNMTHS